MTRTPTAAQSIDSIITTASELRDRLDEVDKPEGREALREVDRALDNLIAAMDDGVLS